LVTDTCVKAAQIFNELQLNELKVELPVGLAAFGSIIKVSYFPEDLSLIKIIEPMYFCIRSYRSEGKHMFFEQTLGKPCVSSVETTDSFIYDIDPKYLAAIRKFLVSTTRLDEHLHSMILEANKFYHLNCYSIVV
jgi:hypothetical protein